MPDGIEQRDFFISFNGADFAYAEAIDVALRAEGFTTFYHPKDLGPGGNIPLWMDNALMNSRQMLALYSPEYMADRAVYSEAERYARFWQDTRGAEFKLIPVELRQTKFTPLLSVYSRIDAKGMTPADAAKAVVAALKTPDEVQQREVLSVQPLPKIFNVLYRHNPNFTGRFEAMESLQKSLREGNAAITALAGMGGVGKTTLAAEYCHRFGGRYGGVWWVRAEQELVMLADLVALGGRLGLAASGNIESDARATLDHLASLTQPWLMVYDNAPDADTVAKWLPAGAVRCIVTSRFAGFDTIATVTALDQWSDQVTADYLLARTGREDKAGALRLARALGGLPLAAEQAAVHLRPRAGTSFDDYAADIAALIKRPRPKGAIGVYRDTVYAALVKSLETLKDIEGGETALDILRLCAFLSPDGVDLGLLRIDEDGDFLPASFAKAIADKSTREDALAALTSLSLLREDDGPAGPVLVFHRLLLEVVRDWMGADARDRWGTAAVCLVGNTFPSKAGDDPSTWSICSRLMTYIGPLEMYAPNNIEAGNSLGRVLNQAGLYLDYRGNAEGALAMAEKTVTLALRLKSVDPLNLAAAFGNLGAQYARARRFDDAEANFRKVFEIERRYLARNDPRLATTLSNLAGVYLGQQKFPKSERFLLRAAKIRKTFFGEQSAEYGTVLANLGAVYAKWASEPGQAAKRTQQEKYTAQALAITRSARGTRHPDIAMLLNNLAATKAKHDDWPGAAADMEREVAIMLSLDLSKHGNMPSDLANLANCWQRFGQSEKAARLAAGDIPPPAGNRANRGGASRLGCRGPGEPRLWPAVAI